MDRNLEQVMEEKQSFLDERQSRRKDSSLAGVEVNVSAVPYDRGKVLCLVAHDVTERKRAERALEEIGGAQPDSPRTPRRHPAEHRLCAAGETVRAGRLR